MKICISPKKLKYNVFELETIANVQVKKSSLIKKYIERN